VQVIYLVLEEAMFLKEKHFTTLLILLGLSFACAAPVLSLTPTAPPVEIIPTGTPAFVPTATIEPTASQKAEPFTSVPAQAAIASSSTPNSFPTISFDRSTNCRRGPAINYFQATSFLKDHETTAQGRNVDSSWLWVVSAMDQSVHCWVSASNLKTHGPLDYLPVIEFPPLPPAPSQLVVEKKSCANRNAITLQWADATGQTGLHFYRDGIMLATLKADATRYTDYPRQAREYIYEVEALNDFGVSVRMAITVPGCVP
jgi:hypothetical protein